MMQKRIPQNVKDKIYKASKFVFEKHGKINISEVQTTLLEDHNICFFNTIELEKLIKESLDKKVFDYV